MELGIYTFGDLTRDPATGRAVSPQQRVANMLEIARLADEAGLDVMGVGEHHGTAFVGSSPPTLLAAMAGQTKRIRLTSATTTIGTLDPVRVFQDYAMVDLISGGRVELVLGRGAYTETFPLFGFNLSDYDALFAEKVELFTQLNAQPRLTWSGRFRPPVHNVDVAPRPAQAKLPVWIGAGSNASVMRAAQWGYPLALPMIGGELDQFAQVARAYAQAWAHFRHQDPLKIAHFAHLHVSDDPKVVERFQPYYSSHLEPLFKGPMSEDAYAQLRSPQGSLVIGNVQEVTDKILAQQQAIGSDRFVGQIDIGGQPQADVLKGIELFAGKVAPAVRKALS